MPYLADPDNRQAIENAVRDMQVAKMNGAELNFTICTILNEFVLGLHGREFGYARINEAMGAATLAPLEWWRRAVTPYEDRKAQDNGDLTWPS